MENLFKHTFIVIDDAKGRRYTIEIPKQEVSPYRIRKIANSIEYNMDFISGVITKDDVLNIFRMNGVACSFKQDFKVMYMRPKVRQELVGKSTKEALDIIQDIVSEMYKIKPEAVKSRVRRHMIHKEMFCFMAKTRIPKIQWAEIAKRVGYKTHATALYHANKINGWVEQEDRAVMEDIDEMDRRLAIKLLTETDKAKIKEFKLD